MSYSKRLLLWGGVLFALCGAGLVLIERFSRQMAGPTSANFERLKTGMSLSEVATILGPPHEGAPTFPPGTDGYFDQTWIGADCVISVHCDQTTHVLAKDFSPRGQTLLQRLRRWIGL
jgi:hypothetical protein